MNVSKSVINTKDTDGEPLSVSLCAPGIQCLQIATKRASIHIRRTDLAELFPYLKSFVECGTFEKAIDLLAVEQPPAGNPHSDLPLVDHATETA